MLTWSPVRKDEECPVAQDDVYLLGNVLLVQWRLACGPGVATPGLGFSQPNLAAVDDHVTATMVVELLARSKYILAYGFVTSAVESL